MSASERTNNTFLAPQFQFPETLAEQEATLRTNSLMQRLLAYRERYEGDPHRPVYHYVNPENTLNDPNGLCFWQDRWHLFYQAYPPKDPPDVARNAWQMKTHVKDPRPAVGNPRPHRNTNQILL